MAVVLRYGLERRWPAGGFSHDFSLVLMPVFPSISTRARLAIVPFLWLVYRKPFLPPPPHRRHAADSRAFSAPPATPAACGRFLMGDYCLVVGSAFLSTAFLRVFLAP